MSRFGTRSSTAGWAADLRAPNTICGCFSSPAFTRYNGCRNRSSPFSNYPILAMRRAHNSTYFWEELYKGRRVTLRGHPQKTTKIGEKKFFIVVKPGYWVFATLKQPLKKRL